MKGLNRVQLIGQVGHDPDVTYTDQGTARTAFNVAINRQWKDADGQLQQETEWLPILTWGALAEIAGEHVTKGKRLYIEGRLHTSIWHTDAGEKRYRTEVVANELIFLSARSTHADAEQADAEQADTDAARQPTSFPAGVADNPPQKQRRHRRQRPPGMQIPSGEPDWDALGL